jgi:hypothetical protein
MSFDIVMPVTLFIVSLIAMFLNKRAEGKLKGVFEEKEFRVRDAALLVASVAVTVSLIVFVPQLAIMIIFLFSYSMILFIFGYLFSNVRKMHAELFLAAFAVVGFVLGASRLLVFSDGDISVYGALTFCGLSVFALAALVYDTRRKSAGERWYLAVLSPALFIGLYVFFSQTSIWFPYLLNSYALIFAVLIILYLSSMFKWGTTLVFVALLTMMDIILVLFTGTMVSAARSVSALRLPVLVSLPTVPTMLYEGNVLYMSLGLGDFFFGGLLTIQMFKRYGAKVAVLAAIAMTVSFFVFEAYLLSREVSAFPGTVMIICGWLPITAMAEIAKKRSHSP